MSQPDAIERLTVALRRDIDAVWAQILAEQAELAAAWEGMTPPQRLNRLRTFEAAVRALADAADEVAAAKVVTAVQGAYETGAWVTATAVGTQAALGALDLDAVVHLAQDTMSDLLRATTGVRDTTKDLVRTLVRDHVRSKLYTGLTAEQAGVRLAADLARNGVHAITYADGRQVGLSTYADMVVRTRTAEAYQEGGFNQGDELGIDWWEVMDGTDCGWSSHDDPVKANGRIIRTAEARQHPLSHPNCRRATTPRADIETQADADAAGPTPTDRQRADQERAEEARAAAYARTPRRVSLDRQVAARLDLQSGALTPAQRRHAARIARATGAPPARVGRLGDRIPAGNANLALVGANPGGHTFNCANTVAAYELRMRGVDVEALPVTAAQAASGGVDVDGFLSRWRTPTGDAPTLTRTKTLAGTRRALEGFGDDARAFVLVQWKRDGGHVFMAQNRGGDIVWMNPQSGAVWDDAIFGKVSDGRAWVVRSDDLTAVDDLTDLVR